MPTVKGRERVAAFFDALPAEIEEKLLRGAARAGATVIADAARQNAPAEEVRVAIRVRTAVEPGRATGKVVISGRWPSSLALWAEYGTSPHYITVADNLRGGRSVRKINDLTKDGTLVINGQPVGKQVFHPGAKKRAFLRPALIDKEAAAIQAAQAYVSARVTPGGITGGTDAGDDDA